MINPKAAVGNGSRLSCHNMPKTPGKQVFYGVGIIREPTPEEMEELPRAHQQKTFLEGKNGIAIGYTA